MSDLKPTKVRVGVETVLALIAGLFGILAMFWRDWIEALTGRDLDRGNGSVEWLIFLAMLAATIAIGIVARRHRTLLTAATE
jgi:Na+/proline symporter